MEYRLQRMYNHIVGRAASVVSPFYLILLGLMDRSWIKAHYFLFKDETFFVFKVET